MVFSDLGCPVKANRFEQKEKQLQIISCKCLSMVRGCFHVPVICYKFVPLLAPILFKCVHFFFIVKSVCFGLNRGRSGTAIRSVHFK